MEGWENIRRELLKDPKYATPIPGIDEIVAGRPDFLDENGRAPRVIPVQVPSLRLEKQGFIPHAGGARCVTLRRRRTPAFFFYTFIRKVLYPFFKGDRQLRRASSPPPPSWLFTLI